MLKKFCYALLLVLFAVTCAGAHPGKLDEYGGHYDAKTGKYHYHKKTKDADLKRLAVPLNVQPNTVYKARIKRVVDGDTAVIIFMLDDGKIYKDERVRFIGANTPETVHPSKAPEYYGKEASNFTKENLTDRVVWIQTDVGARDRYDRLLAYIWTSEPSEKDLDNEKAIRAKMFNAKLLLGGYAQVMTIQPNVRYAEMFLKFQREARENNKGLWNEQN